MDGRINHLDYQVPLNRPPQPHCQRRGSRPPLNNSHCLLNGGQTGHDDRDTVLASALVVPILQAKEKRGKGRIPTGQPVHFSAPVCRP